MALINLKDLIRKVGKIICGDAKLIYVEKGQYIKIGRLSEKHNNCKSNTYSIWTSMLGRCNNPNDKSYKNYGGRGIKVCKEWNVSYKNFINDMGEKPKYKSLDRIDNNGDYTSENCRWATQSQQNYNQRVRRDNTSGAKGVSYHKATSKWLAYIGVNGKLQNLGLFINKDDAIEARKKAEVRYVTN